jgi:hypothetical protein
LAWGGPPHHKGENNTFWFAWLYGASTQPAKELAELARSWNNAPELLTRNADIKNKGYDKTQRAYVLENIDVTRQGKIEFEFDATKESPMVNACIIIENLLSDIVEIRNGSDKLKSGSDYHVGRINTLEGAKQVVWIVNKSTTKESYTLRF